MFQSIHFWCKKGIGRIVLSPYCMFPGRWYPKGFTAKRMVSKRFTRLWRRVVHTRAIVCNIRSSIPRAPSLSNSFIARFVLRLRVYPSLSLQVRHDPEQCHRSLNFPTPPPILLSFIPLDPKAIPFPPCLILAYSCLAGNGYRLVPASLPPIVAELSTTSGTRCSDSGGGVARPSQVCI